MKQHVSLIVDCVDIFYKYFLDKITCCNIFCRKNLEIDFANLVNDSIKSCLVAPCETRQDLGLINLDQCNNMYMLNFWLQNTLCWKYNCNCDKILQPILKNLLSVTLSRHKCVYINGEPMSTLFYCHIHNPDR